MLPNGSQRILRSKWRILRSLMPNEHAVRKWDGGGMQVSCTLCWGQQDVYFYFEEGILNKPWLIRTWLNIVFNMTKKKVKINNTNIFNVSNCSSLLFLTCHVQKLLQVSEGSCFKESTVVCTLVESYIVDALKNWLHSWLRKFWY